MKTNRALPAFILVALIGTHASGVPAGRIGTHASGVPADRIGTHASGVPADRIGTHASGVLADRIGTHASGVPAGRIGTHASGVPAGRRPAYPSDESDVRSTVQRVFDQLKSGQYEALYENLPATSRSRIARDRFVSGLQRTRNLYQLDRIEIGSVRVSGDLAVVDTTMYAHVNKPFDADGKLVVQQYLVRENGSWRVATGDDATINRFLKANPTFARKFPIKRPTAFIKQNGKWVAMPMGRR